MSDKFLQSEEFDRLVPQIQFFSRVWDIPVVEQRQVRTVPNCAEAVLGRMSMRPLLCNDRVMVQRVQKTVLVPQLQFIDVGVDPL